jgi:hypothetical protein
MTAAPLVRVKPSADRGNIGAMRTVRVIADLLLVLLLIAGELVLFPVRLVAALLGGVLLIAGLLGLPAWLIQLVISITGGGSGGGPLPSWEMCLLLAAAIPAGLALLRIASLGVPPEPEGRRGKLLALNLIRARLTPGKREGRAVRRAPQAVPSARDFRVLSMPLPSVG